MASKQFLIDQASTAYLLGCDSRTIQTYGKRAVNPLPVAKQGKRGTATLYDPHQVLLWAIENELAKVIEVDDGTVLNLEQERARLAKEQADKYEMENARLRGELVPVSAVRELLEKVLSTFKTRVLSIPAKIAPLLLGLKSAASAREIVDEHLYDALQELSRLDAGELKKDGHMPGGG